MGGDGPGECLADGRSPGADGPLDSRDSRAEQVEHVRHPGHEVEIDRDGGGQETVGEFEGVIAEGVLLPDHEVGGRDPGKVRGQRRGGVGGNLVAVVPQVGVPQVDRRVAKSQGAGFCLIDLVCSRLSSSG